LSKKKQVEEEVNSAIEKALEEESKKTEEKPKEEKKTEPKKEEVDKDKEIKELTELLQRVQAEFINYKNRTEMEKKALVEYANADLIKKLLPLMDTFEIALKNSQDPEKFRKGMEMLYTQFAELLKQEGVRKIDTQNKKFDPYLHEVLMKTHSEHEEDTILEEFQKGYMLKDKVLRHSKVKISGGKPEKKEEK
jgi:molecular chaperone GrpE